jgi:thioredoxin 1
MSGITLVRPFHTVGPTFNKDIAEGYVLVVFYAAWCVVCADMLPVCLDLANDKLKVFLLDIDEDHDICVEHNIRGVPTLILFKEGQQILKTIGRHSEANIKFLMENIK